MTPVLLQGAVWGYVALCDSSSFRPVLLSTQVSDIGPSWSSCLHFQVFSKAFSFRVVKVRIM